MRNAWGVVRFAASALLSALVGERALHCLWELTYRCNSQCIICRYWRDPSDPKAEMSLSAIQSGLSRIHRYGTRVVNFSGGEPTLRGDLPQILEHASKLGMWTSLVTNGSLLTRDSIRHLKRVGLDSLFISMDSLRPDQHDQQRSFPGLHSQVVSSLQWLSQEFLTGHRTGGVFCVVSSMNEDSLEDIVAFADSIGVYVILQPYHKNKTGESGFAVEMHDGTQDRLLRLKSRYSNIFTTAASLRGFQLLSSQKLPSCHAGRKYFSIDPFGYLHPCVDMPSCGHLLSNDLSVLRSKVAMDCVQTCPGCWYAFRAETDTAMTFRGCLEKAHLATTIIRRNLSRTGC